MPLPSLFKLEKLKIESYDDSKRSSSTGKFEAMFNPESFKEQYGIEYQKVHGLGGESSEAKFMRSVPAHLNLKLILDGTGVGEMGIAKLKPSDSVSKRVQKFLDLAYEKKGDIHEPSYLKVSWGDRWGIKDGGGFQCRLKSVDIEYTSFDRDGSPLRAVLDVDFISDEELTKTKLKTNETSPDLTHQRLVKSGDTLPLLAKSVYGSSEHYLRVAQVNQLDDFRNLTSGQEIFLPPLEK